MMHYQWENDSTFGPKVTEKKSRQLNVSLKRINSLAIQNYVFHSYANCHARTERIQSKSRSNMDLSKIDYHTNLQILMKSLIWRKIRNQQKIRATTSLASMTSPFIKRQHRSLFKPSLKTNTELSCESSLKVCSFSNFSKVS